MNYTKISIKSQFLSTNSCFEKNLKSTWQIYNKYDIRNYAYPKLGEDLNSGVDAKEIADKLGIKHNSFITSTSDLNGSLVFYGEYIGEDECEKIVNRLKELGQIGANSNVQVVSKYNYINDIQPEVPTHVR